jgi:hypothetical protein
MYSEQGAYKPGSSCTFYLVQQMIDFDTGIYYFVPKYNEFKENNQRKGHLFYIIF